MRRHHEHRAEFSGADQRDANRLTGRSAGVEEMVKVHEKVQRGEVK
jgi:hypothetical protein